MKKKRNFENCNQEDLQMIVKLSMCALKSIWNDKKGFVIIASFLLFLIIWEGYCFVIGNNNNNNKRSAMPFTTINEGLRLTKIRMTPSFKQKKLN